MEKSHTETEESDQTVHVIWSHKKICLVLLELENEDMEPVVKPKITPLTSSIYFRAFVAAVSVLQEWRTTYKALATRCNEDVAKARFSRVTWPASCRSPALQVCCMCLCNAQRNQSLLAKSSFQHHLPSSRIRHRPGPDLTVAPEISGQTTKIL